MLIQINILFSRNRTLKEKVTYLWNKSGKCAATRFQIGDDMQAFRGANVLGRSISERNPTWEKSPKHLSEFVPRTCHLVIHHFVCLLLRSKETISDIFEKSDKEEKLSKNCFSSPSVYLLRCENTKTSLLSISFHTSTPIWVCAVHCRCPS